MIDDLVKRLQTSGDVLRCIEAQATRIAGLESALQKIVDSTGCCEACECWRKLRNKASAALERKKQ